MTMTFLFVCIRKEERKIHEKFFVKDYGDWNAVKHHIEQELLVMEQYG